MIMKNNDGKLNNKESKTWLINSFNFITKSIYKCIFQAGYDSPSDFDVGNVSNNIKIKLN